MRRVTTTSSLIKPSSASGVCSEDWLGAEIICGVAAASDCTGEAVCARSAAARPGAHRATRILEPDGANFLLLNRTAAGSTKDHIPFLLFDAQSLLQFAGLAVAPVWNAEKLRCIPLKIPGNRRKCAGFAVEPDGRKSRRTPQPSFRSFFSAGHMRSPVSRLHRANAMRSQTDDSETVA
jgi:hypothetical protein